MEASIETSCRICGLTDGKTHIWKDGEPLYIICECCGMESGIGDETLERVREYRGAWVGEGAKWSEPKRKPAAWNIFEQLANIPLRWR
ncbi:hypothetical protein G3I60_33685 [Streptomyces sp. SID13666]|uniref:hypothetical protein n=1 Tax=unclassified Streptomyces TaxID=2593676 RepID=UPI0013BF181D|nr:MULTISPECIES: hypothetical protein [unclassified Streptomyces]NEA58978.1 hypothetical protein [Streptomyces sp. SID13666]NEA75286.1 hypothetical protein [Streptomyces sp. SID13588]